MADQQQSSGWAQAAVSSSSGLLGGIWDTIWQNKNIEKSIAQNKELADYAYSKDLESWNRANEYNAPSAQMARLSEAGLNPNLVYGKGATATSGSTLPKYNAPTVDYTKNRVPDLQGIVGGFTDTAMKVAQRDNVKANTQLTQQQTLTEGWNTVMKEFMNDKDRFKWLGGYRSRYDRNGNLVKEEDYYEGDRKNYAYETNMKRGGKFLSLTQQEAKNALLNKQLKVMDETLEKMARDNRWAPWEKGVGLGGKVAGSILSAAGIGKAGKILKAAPGGSAYKYKPSFKR